MTAWLDEFLDSYAYVLVAVVVGLESMGLPLPGETILLAAAAYAGVGGLSLPGVIASAAAGAIVGDSIGYWLGRRGGLALLARFPRLQRLTRRKLASAQTFFARYGAATVFLGRFVALLRMFAAFLAGVARMPYATFFFYNVAGGVCWAVLMGLLGFTFGSNLARLERWVGRLGLLALALVGFALVVTVLVHRRRAARAGSP
jgi:membrane protein DedA with SNARE-associated domain